jgi:dihydrofolate reductase
MRSRRGPAAQGKCRARHCIEAPELTSQAINAGLVDEFQMIVCPVVVGGGKRFFPDGMRLDLELVEQQRFRKGVIGN